ncbi:MAG TPA: hypothetical protein IGR64_10100 [Leptolyngbyaceae cyanobacterium M65_K2018_010]|nr:hypothetical protein [Leptolyngbyaceae cyanobacterium M65_K2018_010]
MTSPRWKPNCTCGKCCIALNEQGRLWSQQLELYLGVERHRLRFFSPEGNLITTPEEAATQEQHQAEQARQRADRLAAKVRELGVDPDSV